MRLGMGSEPIGSTGVRIECAVEGSVERSTSDWGEDELLHPRDTKAQGPDLHHALERDAVPFSFP